MTQYNQLHEQYGAPTKHPLLPEPGASPRHLQQIRSQLVAYRTQAGLTQQYVVDHLDWSASKMHRIEDGPSGIKFSDSVAMLGIYGVTDQAERDAFLNGVRVSNQAQKGSQQNDDYYKKELTAATYRYLQSEAEASKISIYEPIFLPEMLQTPSYAAAMSQLVLAQSEQSHDRLEQLRMQRAAYLLGTHGPIIDVILDESVLRRAVGGESLSADERYLPMAQQIEYLDSVISSEDSNPNLTFQVAPADIGYYHASNVSYTILDFPDGKGAPEVYIQDSQGELCLRQGETLAKYRSSFEWLQAEVPKPELTLAMLQWFKHDNRSRMISSVG